MINKAYLRDDVLKSIKNNFIINGVIKLDGFFENEHYKELRRKARGLKFVHKKIPDESSFALAKDIELKEDTKERISSFIFDLTGKKFKIEIKRFRHGDYTIINDHVKNPLGFEFGIFICDGWEMNWGGNKVVVKGKDSLVLVPEENSFILFKTGKEVKSFLQYVNYKSGKNHLIIIEGKGV